MIYSEIGVAFISGYVSAVLSRILHRRQLRKQLAEHRRIAMREYSYWRDSGECEQITSSIEIGATGAASNILAALMGKPAPWHAENYVHDTRPLELQKLERN